MALLSGTVANTNQDPNIVFKVGGAGFENFPGTSYAVTSMFFCNLSQDSTNLNIFLVPQGQTPNSSNLVLKQLPLNALDTFAFDTEKIILDQGDAIAAQASNNDMTVILSIVRVA